MKLNKYLRSKPQLSAFHKKVIIVINRVKIFELLAIFIIASCNFSNGQAGKNDFSFNPTDEGFALRSGPDNKVHAIRYQADGKIIIGGQFRKYCGVNRTMIARLNYDGTLDESFNHNNVLGTYLNSWGSESLDVFTIVIQPDDKILVAGNFKLTKDNKTWSDIIRLNADGTLDESFAYFPDSGHKTFIRHVIIQEGTKILISGRPYFDRLLSDGGKDNSFNIGIGIENRYTPYYPFYSTIPYPYSLPEVYAMVQQAGGKILISGNFNFFNGEGLGSYSPPSYGGPGFIRVNNDGSWDKTFSKPLSVVNDMVSYADGNILLNGRYKMSADGKLDPSFSPAFDDGTAIIQNDQKAIINTHSSIVRLNNNGSVDNTFVFQKQPAPTSQIFKYLFLYDTDIRPYGINNPIYQQPDGKLIIGSSTPILGSTVYLTRLNEDGTPDENFIRNTNGVSGEVYMIERQQDKKILIGGSFISYNGSKRISVARLNQDGSLDESFDPSEGAIQYDQDQNKFAGEVLDIKVQPDGKVLIAGNFTSFNGVERKGIARLNTDGTLDSFNPDFSPRKIGYFSGYPKSILLQPDGKIIFSYSEMYGAGNCKIQRFNSDGTLDQTFETAYLDPADHVIKAILLPDGKILIHGYINAFNNKEYKTSCIRLHGNGQIDNSFNHKYIDLGGAMQVQPDGKILIASPQKIRRFHSDGNPDYSFVSHQLSEYQNGTIGKVSLCLFNDNRILVGGNFPKKLLRLNTNGTINETFEVGEGSGSDFISAICQDEDNRVIVGGGFVSFNGIGRSSIARLHLGKPTQSINFNPIADRTIGDAPFNISANSTTGLPISFSAGSNKITVTGNTVSLTASGRGVVTAYVSGNETYDESSNSISFCINPRPPILNLEPSTTGVSPYRLSIPPPWEYEYAWYKNGVKVLDIREYPYSFSWLDIDLGEPALYTSTSSKEGCVSEPSSFLITGIEDNLNGIQEPPLQLFPNPSRDMVNIQFNFDSSKSVNYEIQIFNLLGKLIKSANGTTTEEIEVDISALSEGLYVVVFNDGRNINMFKFIKR